MDSPRPRAAASPEEEGQVAKEPWLEGRELDSTPRSDDAASGDATPAAAPSWGTDPAGMRSQGEWGVEYARPHGQRTTPTLSDSVTVAELVERVETAHFRDKVAVRVTLRRGALKGHTVEVAEQAGELSVSVEGGPSGAEWSARLAVVLEDFRLASQSRRT